MTFGFPLEQVLQNWTTYGKVVDDIPFIVRKCVQFIEEKGLEEEGIYRLSGSVAQVRQLKERFDCCEVFNLNDTQADCFSVASLLKQFFRELPESLLTNKLSNQFVLAGGKYSLFFLTTLKIKIVL